MNLTPYVEQLHRELAVAAASGGEEAREIAERLTAPLESAVRLALLEALSDAAGEITRDLAPGSVEIRLRGREPEFAVTPPPVEPPVQQARGLRDALAGAIEVTMGVRPPAVEVPPEDDTGGTSRITLRIPEYLKPRIDEAAGRMGLSVNAWLVRAVAAALEPTDATSRPPTGDQLGRKYNGWVR
jgi:hypothetical protein